MVVVLGGYGDCRASVNSVAQAVVVAQAQRYFSYPPCDRG